MHGRQVFSKVLILAIGVIAIATNIFYFFTNCYLDTQLLKNPRWAVERSLQDMKLGYTYTTFQLAFLLGFILSLSYIIVAIQLLKFYEKGRKRFLILLMISAFVELVDYFIVLKKITGEDIYTYIMIAISFLILTRKSAVQLFHN